MKTRILIVTCAIVLISCDKSEPDLDSKLSQLEKQATEAIERQRQLELELAEQKILAERDAIERERTMIEQERLAMEELRDVQNANALAELDRRHAELMERERKISESQRELDDRGRELTGLENELSERELDLAGREPLDALPPVQKNYVSGPTGDFTNFYEPLGAYGSWFQTSDYGYVYQPTIVRDSTWRPYTRGRWAFTDHGWTWVSSEPFGWACYHYGRWALLRNIGWVWIPGNQWAPAWVSWRESPGYIGWAPLPPETLAWHSNSWDSGIDVRFGIDSNWFSFVSYRDFGSDIYSHCLPYTRNLVIYQNTTTVTHYVIRDRIVYCGGPRYRTVCDRIGRRFPIHRLRHDYSPDFGRGGRRLHSQFSGNELHVVAPRMDAEWNPVLRPSRVSRDLGQVVVNRSNELSEDIRKQYRDRKNEDEQKATRWVANTGGREAFENDRKSRIEKNREDVLKNESSRRLDRESGSGNNKPGRTQPPVVTENRSDERSTGLPSNRENKNREADKKSDAEKQAANHLRQQQEAARDEQLRLERDLKQQQQQQADLLRQQELEAKRVRQKQEELDLAQRQQQENQDKLNQQQDQDKRLRERKEQEEKLREIKDKQEFDRKEQQERLRAQQEQIKQAREQQDNLREQQAQKEQAAKQQEEAQRRLKEQQEQLRAQKEQQDKLRVQQEQQDVVRKQQEEAQRRAQEQQERMRAQQEQQERIRQQQEQQERARQQQEEAQRRAQEEAQRRMEEQQRRVQQEQQERQRAQQEQQERARQQQEEAQRRMQERQK